MHRTSLIQLLNTYFPTDSEEIVFKKDILNFINTHKDCFERTLTIGHITASCWLVDTNNNKALLTHHMKLNRWFQLGGHCDGNSDVLAVALTEAREESGINKIEPITTEIFDIDIHLIPENSREKAHYHYDIRFILRVISDEIPILNHESKELRWIDKSIKTLPSSERSMVRMFNKWIQISLPS